MEKFRVIEVLEEMALLLEMKDANVFKIRAFQNAAQVLSTHPADLDQLIQSGQLEELKGIGPAISRIVRELHAEGKSKDHQDLRKDFPGTLFDLFKIQGLGPKRIKILYERLKIKSVRNLEAACRKNQLLALEGFGQKSQDNILKGIEHVKKSSGQYLLDFAYEQADALVVYLKKALMGPGPSRRGLAPLKIEIAGSLRRSKEVIRDLDILVTAKDPALIHKAFTQYHEAESVLAHGDTKSSIALKSGMNADLRTVSEKEFPFALFYFTGSKEHNVVLRTLAKRKNLKINEYGVFKGRRLIPCKDEADIYKVLGLHYIPPEARENNGEVEWAAKKEFPELLKDRDLRGVFHVHSTYSDGRAPLEAMIAEAERLGYEYVGISDHSQSAGYANGMKPERVRGQWKEIDRLQKKFKIRIFKGIESDILTDGSLDYPESILRGFDFVIGSVHTRFNLSEAEMTKRIMKAMDHPHLTFVGHPTGRLLLAREGYGLDLEKIIGHAQKLGVVIELNANPHRLDLDWRFGKLAKEKGILLSVNPDAHSVKGLSDVKYGTGIARKAWLGKEDVVNTMPLDQMEKFLIKRK